MGNQPRDSLEAGEEVIRKTIMAIGSTVPLEVILKRLRNESFERQCGGYATKFKVDHMPYAALITESGFLSLRRNSLGSDGTVFAEYNSPRVTMLYQEIEGRSQHMGSPVVLAHK